MTGHTCASRIASLATDLDASNVLVVSVESMMTMYFRTNRVRVMVDANGLVVQTPSRGQPSVFFELLNDKSNSLVTPAPPRRDLGAAHASLPYKPRDSSRKPTHFCRGIISRKHCQHAYTSPVPTYLDSAQWPPLVFAMTSVSQSNTRS
jgi:hypothetical protein